MKTAPTKNKGSRKARKGENRTPLLPRDHLEPVEAWGMASSSMAHVFRPSVVEGVEEVFELARKSGRKVGFRGGGRSYGDAFQNAEEILLDLSRMKRILEWDPGSGKIKVEPGVRLVDLWEYVLGDGYWPPVVSGTMFTTVGGCASMNIHGKNAYKVGPFGDHILEFEFLTPNGEKLVVNRENYPDLFFGAIGGFGVLGVFTSITLQLKKIYSGLLEVFPRHVEDFKDMADQFEAEKDKKDYMVGWVDCFARGKKLGRGEMHFARQLEPGEDAVPAQTLQLTNQSLPENIMGLIPRSIMWKLSRPIVTNFGMKWLNRAKYFFQLRPGGEKDYMQSHAAFHFLLDYVPNWKWSYRPGGLIQYQSFVPVENAVEVFEKQIELTHQRGIYSYLGVTKKHRKDDFLMTHGLDGYSLAMDFPVTKRNREDLWSLCHEMDQLVLEAGGKLYFAKDSTMKKGTADEFIPSENLEKFMKLKNACDPEGLISSNLYRRVFD